MDRGIYQIKNSNEKCDGKISRKYVLNFLFVLHNHIHILYSLARKNAITMAIYNKIYLSEHSNISSCIRGVVFKRK